MNERTRISRSLGVDFVSPALLETALTHRSFGTPHNERLEFLGDGVLNCVVADLLYSHFPELDEGELSRLRANVVRQESLHGVALAVSLGDFLRLGDGEEKSGGRTRASILADAVEALIGAVYVDAGFASARELVKRLFGRMIEAIDPAAGGKDAKTRLQEWLQAGRHPLPRYSVTATSGEAHAQLFEVACELTDHGFSTAGRGTSRRLAEQQAAEAALARLAQS